METMDGDNWRLWNIADQTVSCEELHAADEKARILRKALSHLRPNLRNVLEIYQLNDRSLKLKEVAKLAGISVAATKSRLSRARGILRKTLERDERTRAVSSRQESMM